MKVYISNLKNNEIFRDSVLNILASIVLTLAVQIIAYPILARVFDSSDYGVILTIMGLVNAVSASVGNSLNISRLLMENSYKKIQLQGDFNPFFWITTFSSSIILAIILLYLNLINRYQILLIITLITLISFRAYYTVGFRIIVSYKDIFITNLLGLIGYIIGSLVLSITHNWIHIFLVGELFMCIYIFFKSTTVRESFKITKLLRKSLRNYVYVLSSSGIGNLVLYMDRFLILPILGSNLVSIYSVASFLGKTTGIIMNPISSVLLTYFTKESKLNRKNFYKRLMIIFLATLTIYIGIILFDDLIINFLYPDLFEQAKLYFEIASLGSIVLIFGNTIQPLMLQFSDEKWQLIVQLIYIIVYVILSMVLMNKYDLLGFCYAVLIANTLRAVIMIIIVNFSVDK